MIKHKQVLRQEMRQLRDNLTPEERRAAARAVAATLADFLKVHYPQSQRLSIAVYAAIQSELDLSECWTLLQNWPADLYFPAVCGNRLCFGKLPEGVRPVDFLHSGVFGVPEPPPQSLLNQPPELDFVLVPGLAFDMKGRRLGWGKAYYDRFLTDLPRSTLRVGVCYSGQIVPAVPADRHDQTMHRLLTPEQWMACEAQP